MNVRCDANHRAETHRDVDGGEDVDAHDVFPFCLLCHHAADD